MDDGCHFPEFVRVSYTYADKRQANVYTQGSKFCTKQKNEIGGHDLEVALAPGIVSIRHIWFASD